MREGHSSQFVCLCVSVTFSVLKTVSYSHSRQALMQISVLKMSRSLKIGAVNGEKKRGGVHYEVHTTSTA